MYIPDPTEILDIIAERSFDEFTDINTCMQCNKKVDYEIICVDPLGVGPAYCEECAGVKFNEEKGTYQNYNHETYEWIDD